MMCKASGFVLLTIVACVLLSTGESDRVVHLYGDTEVATHDTQIIVNEVRERELQCKFCFFRNFASSRHRAKPSLLRYPSRLHRHISIITVIITAKAPSSYHHNHHHHTFDHQHSIITITTVIIHHHRHRHHYYEDHHINIIVISLTLS